MLYQNCESKSYVQKGLPKDDEITRSTWESKRSDCGTPSQDINQTSPINVRTHRWQRAQNVKKGFGRCCRTMLACVGALSWPM